MLNKFSWIYYSRCFLELRLNTDKIKYNCVFRSLLIHKNLLSININICLFNLYKFPLGETGCLGSFYFTCWLPKHRVIWFILILTQSVRLTMVTYTLLCSTCMTYQTLCYAIGHQVLPTQLLSREACTSAYILNLLITKRFIYRRFYLPLRAARICEESASRRTRTLSTVSLACWKYFILSVWQQSLMISKELKF